VSETETDVRTPADAPSVTTILFTDVEGSTDLSRTAGDRAAQDLLHAHESIVREQVAAQGGREVKNLGDGFMLAFPSPRHAVECAVAVQLAMGELSGSANRDGLQVRMGLHAGEVFERAGDLFGATVNFAARVVAKARGGQILASESVKEMAGATPITFVDRGLFWLKGFPERQRLFEVVWREGATPVRVTPSAQTRTSFVGREAELADLRRYVEEASEGHGALVLVGGEPGVGKTRLVLEAAEEASQFGMMALVGRCYEMETATPYLPLIEILESASRGISRESFREVLGDSAAEIARLTPELRRLFPDLPEPLDLPPEQARRYLFNSVWDFMDRAGQAHPLVLVMDDLHWSDESTLLLLEHLAERLSDMRVLMLGTYRDVELDVARPLARTLEALVRRRLAHRIFLKRLGVDEVRGMVDQLAGQEAPEALVALIYEETEGNPFFVEEVFQHLAEEGKLFDDDGQFRPHLVLDELDVPESVRLVVGRRLERMSDEAKEMLAAAAIMGRRFRMELLEAMGMDADRVMDALEEAEKSRLVSSSMEGASPIFEFGHELIRQTLLAGISVLRRQRLHGKAAEALERVHAAELKEHAGDVAHHLLQAGSASDPLKLVGYLALAGDRAMEQAAFEEALGHFENALSVSTVGKLPLALLKEKRGAALQSLGRYEEGIGSWREALDLYEQEEAGESLAELCVLAASHLGWGSRWAEAVEMAQRGLTAGTAASPSVRVRLLAIAGVLVSLAGAYEEGEGLIAEAEALAEQFDDEAMMGQVLSARAVHHWGYAEMRETIEHGVPGADRLRRTGNLWQLATTLPFVEWAYTYTGQEEEAERVFQELEPLSRRLGHYGSLTFALRDSSIRQTSRAPDLAEQEQAALRDFELSRQAGSGIFLAQSYTWLGTARFFMGRWEEALPDLEMGSKVEAEIPGVFTGISLGAELQCRIYIDPEGAGSVVQAAWTRLPILGRPTPLGSLALLLATVEALPRIGRPEEAGALYPLIRQTLDSGVIHRTFGWTPVEALAGLSAGCAGDWDTAERHFVAVTKRMEESDRLMQVPECLRLHAETLLRRGDASDGDRARGLLERARDNYQAFGMPKHVELCEQVLAKA
jgi:class 3 adenylate cyclase/tetratricopeptide (TPR) repeat protein